jgi:tRNA(fMet)-specific endonuclease VapC
MMHLLDTNTCVEFLRRGRSTPLAARLLARPAGSVVLCSVVIAELLYGAERSNDPPKVCGEVATFTAGYVSLPFDDAAAAHYAPLRHALASRGLRVYPISKLSRDNG